MHQIEGCKTSNRDTSPQSLPTPSHNHPQTNSQRKEQEQNQFMQGKMKQVQSFPENKQDNEPY